MTAIVALDRYRVPEEDVVPVVLPEQEVDDTNIAEIFHENTKFFRSTFLPQAARIVAFLTRPQLMIRGTRGFYANLLYPRVALSPGQEALAQHCAILAARQSGRSFSGAPVTMEQIGSLLHFALRANRVAPVAEIATNHFRPYPSGGALYPTECYVIGLEVEERRPFVAHYDQRTHELELLDEDFDAARFGRSLCRAEEADGIAAAIVLTSVFSRSTAKYGPRGYRFALLEAGHAAQNLSLAAAAHDLSACLNGGYFDDEVNALCGADGVIESVVTCLFLGHRGSDDGNSKYGPSSAR